MNKGFLSAAMSLLCSNFAFGMGVQAVVMAVPTATTLATAVVAAGLVAVVATPTPAQAGTLNPPELIYEDGKVKVEKVWEEDLGNVEKVFWYLTETNDEMANNVYVGNREGKKVYLYPAAYKTRNKKGIVFLNERRQQIKNMENVGWMGDSFENNRLILYESSKNHGVGNIYLTDYKGEIKTKISEGIYGNAFYLKNESIAIEDIGEDSISKIIYFYKKDNKNNDIQIEKNFPHYNVNNPPKFASDGNLYALIDSEGKISAVEWNDLGDKVWEFRTEQLTILTEENYVASEKLGIILNYIFTPEENGQYLLIINKGNREVTKIKYPTIGSSKYFRGDSLIGHLFHTKQNDLFINIIMREGIKKYKTKLDKKKYSLSQYWCWYSDIDKNIYLFGIREDAKNDCIRIHINE